MFKIHSYCCTFMVLSGSTLLSACEVEVYEHENPPSSSPTHNSETASDPSPNSSSSGLPAAAKNQRRLSVDRFKELLIIDRSVLDDARASNAVEDAAWSFRTQFEWLSGNKSKAPSFTRKWLEQWESVTQVGPNNAPVAPRPRIRELLIEPW